MTSRTKTTTWATTPAIRSRSSRREAPASINSASLTETKAPRTLTLTRTPSGCSTRRVGFIRDNVYGTIDADVWRRDFTCNALYYNIADFSIWDYVGGFEDVAARKLKLIGDPETRFREDPVRMLRAARFEAKLGFEIDPATSEPIRAAESADGWRAAGTAV